MGKIKDWGHLKGDIKTIREHMAKNRFNSSTQPMIVRINKAMLKVLTHIETDLEQIDNPAVQNNIRVNIEFAAILDSIWAKAEQYLNKNFCHITENNAELEALLKEWFVDQPTTLKTLTDLLAHAEGDLLVGDWQHPANDLDDVLKVIEVVSKAHSSYCTKFKPAREMRNDIQCMINDTKIKDWGHLKGDIKTIREHMAKNRFNSFTQPMIVRINKAMLKVLTHIETDLEQIDNPAVQNNIRVNIEFAAILDSIWAKAEQYLNKSFCHITENNAEPEALLKEWFVDQPTTLKTLTDLLAHAEGDLLVGDWQHPANDLDDVLKHIEEVSKTQSSYTTKAPSNVVSSSKRSGEICWVALGLIFFMI